MGGLVRIMRECQGTMTQTQFGRLLGVSQSTISMIYGGWRRPGRRVIARLGARFPERREEIAAVLFSASDYPDRDVPITHVQDPSLAGGNR